MNRGGGEERVSQPGDVSPDPSAVARAAVARVRQVATLPEAALRVARIAEDPESTPQALSEAFEGDPALCAQLLKVANSAFYGMRSEVITVEHAAVVLGRRAVRSVALAASLAQITRAESIHDRFLPSNLWRHSLGTAATCRVLAGETGTTDPEEAFVAGLIHDVGLLVELQDDRPRFAGMLDALGFDDEARPLGELLEVEREWLGAAHPDFGASLCESWGLPARLSLAVAFHHDPLAAGTPDGELSALVYVAERLGVGFEHGFGVPALEPLPEVLEALALAPDALPALRELAADAAAAAEAAFTQIESGDREAS